MVFLDENGVRNVYAAELLSFLGAAFLSGVFWLKEAEAWDKDVEAGLERDELFVGSFWRIARRSRAGNIHFIIIIHKQQKKHNGVEK
jgi:hypothetical protein